MNTPILSIVVPCYNEEAVLNETIKRLTAVMNDLIKDQLIMNNSFIVFVDDGSKDLTWSIIEQHNQVNPFVKGLKLSKNRGHQNALLAGMESVVNKSDCMISIDADLQDDINVMKLMLNKYYLGNEIVYGVRKSRTKDSFFKKHSAEVFYKFMHFLGVNTIYNHADYRLMSKRALNFLLKYTEKNLFLLGVVPEIGLNNEIVYYDRFERFAGESKYPFKKMLSFAIDGITSFSVVPLRVISVIGFLIFIFSLLMGSTVLFTVLFTDKTVPGWASTVLPIYFIGGIQLLSLGIIGEYIGKIYKETKQRPRYFIEKEI